VKCPIEIFCGDSLPPKKTLETFLILSSSKHSAPDSPPP
jgi:hypothetical protein